MSLNHDCSTDRTVTVELLGISARGYHGVLPQERDLGQPFTVDVRLTVPEPTGDALYGSVDYSVVAREVAAIIAGPAVNLIETLALRIMERCLAYPRVQEASVTVHKPHAPMGVPFEDVAVTVTRRN
jgi:dihydroneopterin aldolase